MFLTRSGWLRRAASKSEISWLIERFDQLTGQRKKKPNSTTRKRSYVALDARFRFHANGHAQPTRNLSFITMGHSFNGARSTAKMNCMRHRRRCGNCRAKEGEKALDLAREASTIRYRELYGFTQGDPAHVYEADMGRGVRLFLMGLPRESDCRFVRTTRQCSSKTAFQSVTSKRLCAVRAHGKRVESLLHLSRW